MEDHREKSNGEDKFSEKTGQHFGKENFRMFYALGPEVDQGNSIDYEGNEGEEYRRQKFEEDKESYLSKEPEGYTLSDTVDVKDGELSDDSGTVDDNEWKGSSIPPDIVASANHLKVIRVEPRKNLGTDVKKHEELFQTPCDQDITDFRRHQVEAYTNLEDLLDEPWEESDFAPPSKVDVVLRVGGELGKRYGNIGAQGRRKMRVMQKAGLDPAQYQCGPLCNNCSIM